ncbi:hypothetical protein [Anatilimnocola floriformis]|uniref:hypothetical protein n=1 Tax=Anatilimnocola floriformis TaxID=2948575 RepID=UPI0020C2BBD2|nr:hypothetical protein [Anatilimnocola floriformis]
MTNPIQQARYEVQVGQASYPVRLMLGRPGYWGEWQCPLCGKVGRSIPAADEHAARAAVLLVMGSHHIDQHS